MHAEWNATTRITRVWHFTSNMASKRKKSKVAYEDPLSPVNATTLPPSRLPLLLPGTSVKVVEVDAHTRQLKEGHTRYRWITKDARRPSVTLGTILFTIKASRALSLPTFCTEDGHLDQDALLDLLVAFPAGLNEYRSADALIRNGRECGPQDIILQLSEPCVLDIAWKQDLWMPAVSIPKMLKLVLVMVDSGSLVCEESQKTLNLLHYLSAFASEETSTENTQRSALRLLEEAHQGLINADAADSESLTELLGSILSPDPSQRLGGSLLLRTRDTNLKAFYRPSKGTLTYRRTSPIDRTIVFPGVLLHEQGVCKYLEEVTREPLSPPVGSYCARTGSRLGGYLLYYPSSSASQVYGHLLSKGLRVLLYERESGQDFSLLRTLLSVDVVVVCKMPRACLIPASISDAVTWRVIICMNQPADNKMLARNVGSLPHELLVNVNITGASDPSEEAKTTSVLQECLDINDHTTLFEAGAEVTRLEVMWVSLPKDDNPATRALKAIQDMDVASAPKSMVYRSLRVWIRSLSLFAPPVVWNSCQTYAEIDPDLKIPLADPKLTVVLDHIKSLSEDRGPVLIICADEVCISYVQHVMRHTGFPFPVFNHAKESASITLGEALNSNPKFVVITRHKDASRVNRPMDHTYIIGLGLCLKIARNAISRSANSYIVCFDGGGEEVLAPMYIKGDLDSVKHTTSSQIILDVQKAYIQ